MKPVLFHRDAEEELENAVAWYENQREGLGAQLRERVEEGAHAIQKTREGIHGTDSKTFENVASSDFLTPSTFLNSTT